MLSAFRLTVTTSQTSNGRRAIVHDEPVSVAPDGGSDGDQHRKTEIYIRARQGGDHMAARRARAATGDSRALVVASDPYSTG
jgi:hypothetical protein